MSPLKNSVLHGKTVNKVSEHHIQVILVQNWHANFELIINPRHWKESGKLNFIQM